MHLSEKKKKGKKKKKKEGGGIKGEKGGKKKGKGRVPCFDEPSLQSSLEGKGWTKRGGGGGKNLPKPSLMTL